MCVWESCLQLKRENLSLRPCQSRAEGRGVNESRSSSLTPVMSRSGPCWTSCSQIWPPAQSVSETDEAPAGGTPVVLWGSSRGANVLFPFISSYFIKCDLVFFVWVWDQCSCSRLTPVRLLQMWSSVTLSRRGVRSLRQSVCVPLPFQNRNVVLRTLATFSTRAAPENMFRHEPVRRVRLLIICFRNWCVFSLSLFGLAVHVRIHIKTIRIFGADHWRLIRSQK